MKTQSSAWVYLNKILSMSACNMLTVLLIMLLIVNSRSIEHKILNYLVIYRTTSLAWLECGIMKDITVLLCL